VCVSLLQLTGGMRLGNGVIKMGGVLLSGHTAPDGGLVYDSCENGGGILLLLHSSQAACILYLDGMGAHS